MIVVSLRDINKGFWSHYSVRMKHHYSRNNGHSIFTKRFRKFRWGKNEFYLTQVPILLGFYSTLSHLLSFLYVYMTRSHLIRPLSIGKISSGKTGLPIFRKVCAIYIPTGVSLLYVNWKTPDKNRDYVRFKVVSFRVKLSLSYGFNSHFSD